MHYMVIERFRNQNPTPIYERLKAKGRMMPEGLQYISSWITEDLSLCYQVMQAPDRALLEQWMAHWSDLMEFEVLPVLTSAEVQKRLTDASPAAGSRPPTA